MMYEYVVVKHKMSIMDLVLTKILNQKFVFATRTHMEVHTASAFSFYTFFHRTMFAHSAIAVYHFRNCYY